MVGGWIKGWLFVRFWSAVLPLVPTGSDRVVLGTFAVNTDMWFPSLTWGFTSSDLAVSELTFTFAADPGWTAFRVVLSWSATAWAFSGQIDRWAEVLITLALRPAAVGVIWVNSWFEHVVIWTASWGGWNVSDRAAVAAVGLATWAFPFVTAAVVSLFDKDWSDIDVVTFASFLGFAGLALVVELLEFVAGFTFPRPTSLVVDFVNFKFLDEFAFIVLDFADAFHAWDWGLFKLVVPAVVPHASRPVFISLTWLDGFIA